MRRLWLQGSPGRLRGRKGESYEGGMRVPMLARMPGRIPAGSVAAGLASHLDLLPTLANLGGAALPVLPLDGVDITAMLEGRASAVDREAFLFFDYWNVQCARLGKWKLHLTRTDTLPWLDALPDGRTNLPLPRPELYDVDRDPGESYECGLENRKVMAEIQARVLALLDSFPVEVREAWRETQSRRTRWTPTGAMPAKASP